jgi:sugar lactone lactonase YvrE
MSCPVELTTTIVAGGLLFPEAPRWHGEALWFVDMEGHTVNKLSAAGAVEKQFELDDYTSGIGWLPDGALIVVSVKQRRIMRWTPDGGVSGHAELSGLSDSFINDMVVNERGCAWVGSMGFDVWQDPESKPGALYHVAPDGAVKLAASDLQFPNGSVITPDGKTLIVAESLACQLTAFEIASDGSLHNRRLWAATGDARPDGICLDAENAVWIASPNTAQCLRIKEGGEVTHRIAAGNGRESFAVMLGGADGRTLYVLTSSPVGDTRDNRMQTRPGQIETVLVEVPAAGLP